MKVMEYKIILMSRLIKIKLLIFENAIKGMVTILITD